MTITRASTDLIDLHVEGILRTAPRDPEDLRSVTLAQFVQSDVQADDATARDWLDRLDAVESGDMEKDDGTGNAFTLYLDRTGATIENAIFPEDPTVRLRHHELRQALEAVLVVLERHRARK